MSLFDAMTRTRRGISRVKEVAGLEMPETVRPVGGANSIDMPESRLFHTKLNYVEHSVASNSNCTAFRLFLIIQIIIV
jgi:hypothetical protein